MPDPRCPRSSGRLTAILADAVGPAGRVLALDISPKRIRPTKIHVPFERGLFLAGFYTILSIGAGPCRWCRECSFEGCRRPEDARPSMEACGIDAFATVRANRYPFEVVRDDGDESDGPDRLHWD